MTAPRAPRSDAQDRERFAAGLLELTRKIEQLERALEPFEDPAGGTRAFADAWGSEDPEARNRAELVHATFERSHQQMVVLVRLAAKIGARSERLPDATRSEAEPARLRGAGVLTPADVSLIADHVEVRNQGRRGYLGQVPEDVLGAARAQLRRAPAIVMKLDDWLEGEA